MKVETRFLRFGLRAVMKVETRFLLALSALQDFARVGQRLYGSIGNLDRRRS
jgi:hypothetical protein